MSDSGISLTRRDYSLFTKEHLVDLVYGKSIELQQQQEEIERLHKMLPDNCEICNGERGGVRGNENIVNGKVVCDYCSVDPDYKSLQQRLDEAEKVIKGIPALTRTNDDGVFCYYCGCCLTKHEPHKDNEFSICFYKSVCDHLSKQENNDG